jgi:hypothetical protein
MPTSLGLFDGVIVTQMCDGASGDVVLEQQYARVVLEAFALWKERHKKYGRGNIGRYGATGCLVRLGDKTSRLEEVYIHGKSDFPDETIEDSWLDAINYPIMGLICHRGGWPGVSSGQPDKHSTISGEEHSG